MMVERQIDMVISGLMNHLTTDLNRRLRDLRPMRPWPHIRQQNPLPHRGYVVNRLARHTILTRQPRDRSVRPMRRQNFNRNVRSLAIGYIISSGAHEFSPCVVGFQPNSDTKIARRQIVNLT